MQVRINDDLKKPIKIYAAENNLSVPKATERLITTSDRVLLPLSEIKISKKKK